MADNDSGLFGEKIFFLHPPGILQNQVITELAQDEFEVYIAKDENKLKQALKKFPQSIVFACINEGMKENAWEVWIRGVMGNAENAGTLIGIITSENDDAVRRKYTEQLKVPCGFTVVKSDANLAIKQLTSILNSVNAKGRRKYIRALTDKEANITVNIPMNGTFVNGAIKDISVVGFSCSFADDPELSKNSLFEDIQIRLQSQLLKAEGIVFGSRMEGDQKVYVILFSKRVDQSIKLKIRKYIQSNLQSKMNEEIK